MMIVLLVPIAMLLFALGAAQKRSMAVYRILMLFFWCMIVCCTESFDLNNYRYVYEAQVSQGRERFYDAVKQVFVASGASFNLFKAVWGSVTWLLLYKGIRKYTEYAALSAALFMIMPFIGFITQIRSSLAGAIVICAIPYILRNNKRDIWIYALLIALATVIHRMAAFYFIFLVCPLIKTSVKRYRVFMFAVVLIGSYLFTVKTSLMEGILKLLSDTTSVNGIKQILLRVLYYFNSFMRANTTGFLFNTAHQLTIFILVEWACTKMQKQPEIALTNNYYTVSSLIMVQKINITLLLLIPLYGLTLSFNRMFYYLLPLFYGVILQGVAQDRKAGRDLRDSQIAVLLLIMCTVFVFAVLVSNDLDEFTTLINSFAKW